MRLRSIPGKLYGRDRELEELRQVYQQVVEDGNSRLILLEGFSGSGKSSLIHHFGKSIQPKACFIKGKFDEQNLKPYAAFSQAFRGYVDYLLRHWDDEEECIEAIRKAVGCEWNILKEIIPNLQDLFSIEGQERGQSSSLRRSTTDQTMIKRMSQFHFRFKQFVRAACSTAPLMLYLDDLHWSDMSSLELLKTIVSDGKSKNLLLIGSYRGNELHESHPLYGTISHLKNQGYDGAKLIEMELPDLGLDDLNVFVADSLDQVPEKTLSLTLVIKRKTNGNPFYTKQLLQHLVHEELVSYDMVYFQWVWDVYEISGATDLSENAVELVVSRIKQLPDSVVQILKVASCLWYSFEVSTLEFILVNIEKHFEKKNISIRMPLEESKELGNEMFKPVDKEHQSAVLQGLRMAAEHGLLDEMGANGFKFAHDRIREAAYSLVAEGEQRDSMHLYIGELLWCMFLSQRSQHWMLFSSVDQLNKVSYQVHGDKLRLELAEVNLEAARQSIALSAFLPAIQYLKSGAQFLGEQPWSHNYSTCLTIYSKLASLESSVGRPCESSKYVDAVLEKANCFGDKLSVYATRIESLCVGGKLQESLSLAFKVLGGIGENFPCSTKGKNFERIVYNDKLLTGRMLSQHTDASILALPQLKDPRKEYALRILNLVADAAFHTGQMGVLHLLINRMIRISLQYGLGDASGVAFALYGFALDSKGGNHKQNYRYGKLALMIQERLEAKECMCRLYVFVYVLLNHWQEPLQKSLDPLLTAYDLGMQCQDIDYAFQAAGAYYTLHWYCGNELKTGANDLRNFCAQMREYKQDKALTIYLPLLQCLINMSTEASQGSILCGDAINEEEYIELKTSNTTVQSYQMQLAYYFDDLELAEEMASKLQLVGNSFSSHYLFVARKFFFGLVSLRVAIECKAKTKKKTSVKLAKKVMKEMEQWSANGGLNCLHKLLILKAESKAFDFLNPKCHWVSKKGSIEDIRAAYDMAITTAIRSGFRNDAALACERASAFLELCDNDYYWSETYLSRALEYYNSWGASAKVKHIIRTQQSRRKMFRSPSASLTFQMDSRDAFKSSSIQMHKKVHVKHTSRNGISSVKSVERASRGRSSLLVRNAVGNNGFLSRVTNVEGRDETESTIEASRWSVSSLVRPSTTTLVEHQGEGLCERATKWERNSNPTGTSAHQCCER